MRFIVAFGVMVASLVGLGVAGTAQVAKPAGCANPVVFTHVLTNKPLPNYKPTEVITPAVTAMRCSRKNVYVGNAAAIGEGKKLFAGLCASCHGPDAKGRIGPNLTDAVVKYDRVKTDQGMFEVIYGGTAGAMQPMGRRFTQDQILQIMAYTKTLK